MNQVKCFNEASYLRLLITNKFIRKYRIYSTNILSVNKGVAPHVTNYHWAHYLCIMIEGMYIAVNLYSILSSNSIDMNMGQNSYMFWMLLLYSNCISLYPDVPVMYSFI